MRSGGLDVQQKKVRPRRTNLLEIMKAGSGLLLCFSVASVTLSLSCVMLSLTSLVLRERSPDIVRFDKSPFLVSPDVAFVGACIDKFTIRFFLRRHF